MSQQPLSCFEVFLYNLTGPLPVQAVRSKALNGLFYTEMGRRFPSWVDRMHASGQKPLPFSISLMVDNGLVQGFRIRTLEADAAEKVAEIWGNLAAARAEIRLGSAQMRVTHFQPESGMAKTYAQLIDECRDARRLRLRFITPTRLKMFGHDTLLPIPYALWRGYAARWEAYAPEFPPPPEFARWVEFQVAPIEAQIQTCFAYEEGDVEWTGFVGEVAFQAHTDSRDIPAARMPDYLRMWQALAQMAEYSGTGEKTARGMGFTQFVQSRRKSFEPDPFQLEKAWNN
ncbi:MAG TPA: CRISPR system precrRNA processing endoribonuclease RAMP protein Cas6 [Anaerolineaceae bacterium]|nr:CRISPR system precrRNA processing endoribonuclease RAMP protein Cas6 [Anaerolineaceae bacterium]HPN53851.1 CRISPR system precrRNA processing endoribonuclease RAMP protein Cas6 [Anaerolineaceae bacterium]